MCSFKAGDIVVSKIWGNIGLVLVGTQARTRNAGRPGKLVKVLWSDGIQNIEHVNNVRLLSEDG